MFKILINLTTFGKCTFDPSQPYDLLAGIEQVNYFHSNPTSSVTSLYVSDMQKVLKNLDADVAVLDFIVSTINNPGVKFNPYYNYSFTTTIYIVICYFEFPVHILSNEFDNPRIICLDNSSGNLKIILRSPEEIGLLNLQIIQRTKIVLPQNSPFKSFQEYVKYFSWKFNYSFDKRFIESCDYLSKFLMKSKFKAVDSINNRYEARSEKWNNLRVFRHFSGYKYKSFMKLNPYISRIQTGSLWVVPLNKWGNLLPPIVSRSGINNDLFSLLKIEKQQ